MARLYSHTSNRLEVLADHLADVLREPPRSPFAPEVIVVQSQGMGRWLKLELAERLGICANVRFLAPEAFAHETFVALLADVPKQPRFTRDVLRWAVLESLSAAATDGLEAPELAHYLAASDPRHRYQLAEKLAFLFEQYPVHRPELVLEWDSGGAGDWQARLWRAVVERLGPAHPAALRRKLATLPPLPAGALPERLSVFGVSSLPQFHLGLLAWLGERLPVHLFRVEPSREYWSEIRTPRQQTRELARAGQPGLTADAAHHEVGHGLLASLGLAGRDFQKLLLEAGDWQDTDDFRAPGAATLLHALQDDILHLRNRGTEPDAPRLPIAREDDSLRVHCCHSPLREVEVLQDHLLDWFQREPTLRPREVLVMTPDIEAYAPALQAVFESPEDEARRIPFSLADRAARREHRVVDAFLRLLALPDTRLSAPEVLAPLETAAVRARFGLAERDVELARHWVRESGIRWGRDAAHKAAEGLPALPENTWRHGLDRLLLGQALPGDGQRLLAGILPYPEIEGDGADLLGRFGEYVETVFATVEALREPRTAGAWQEFLTGMLGRFFLEDEDCAEELGVTRAALADWRQQAERAGCASRLPLALAQEALGGALAEERYGSGFLTGGVTCCALKPMRSIPFRVIAVLGLNDGAFPRADARLAFDLMAAQPRPGDRSTRADDRYLFLETLLSARDRLHLSYVGRSQQDDTGLPPSVVVSELLDTVRQGFALAGADEPEALVKHLVTPHRLHAFSAAYFDGRDERLFSFSEQNLAASGVAGSRRRARAPFVAAPLSEPEPEFRQVNLESLIQFLLNPSKFLLKQRLGLAMPREFAALEDREPFAVAELDEYRLQQELLDTWLTRGRVEAALGETYRAAGRLPPGESGAVAFAEQRLLVEELGAKALDLIGGAAATRREVEFTSDGFQVRGVVAGVFGDRLLVLKPAKQANAKDLLRLWIALLAVNAGEGQSLSGGWVVARGEVREFAAPPEAAAELKRLLELYWQGLREPLPFFPKTSLAYAERRHGRAEDKRESALGAAAKVWEPASEKAGPGESEDEWISQCFGHAEPFDARFEEVALRVFGPLLDAEVARPRGRQ